jgi:hypothetical protein
VVKTLLRLFVIKSRPEAWAIIYALALGAVTRGAHYHDLYPGIGGWLLFAACTGAVFMAGAKILDSTRPIALRKASMNRMIARARKG